MSPAAWDSHRKRRAAVTRILDPAIYRLKEVNPSKTDEEVKYLDDQENTHELVEFIVLPVVTSAILSQHPVLVGALVYIGGKLVDGVAAKTINAAQALLGQL